MFGNQEIKKYTSTYICVKEDITMKFKIKYCVLNSQDTVNAIFRKIVMALSTLEMKKG